MKYKAGDTVRIRSKKWIDAREKDYRGWVPGTTRSEKPIYINDMMFRYAGIIAHITDIDDDKYRLDVDGGRWWWADWMFDPDYKTDGPLPLGEAIIAMVQDSEKLFDGEGNEHVWTGSSFIKIDKKTHINVVSYKFDGLYRRPPEAQAAYDTGGGAGVGGER